MRFKLPGHYNPGWWNSANCMTVLGDLAALDSTVLAEAKDVFTNTLVQAQEYNLQMVKLRKRHLVHSYYWNRHAVASPSRRDVDEAEVVYPKGFLNDYYDDEGWWALAWINAYDLTSDSNFLLTAIDIFDDIRNGTSPCGGIYWSKTGTYVNAIANELALSVAAHLANRVTDPSLMAEYYAWAQTQWAWFQASTMINPQSTINDGLTDACQHNQTVNNNGTVWSYNQGVILGALIELATATTRTDAPAAVADAMLATAATIAHAAIAALSDANGILHDVCEPDCGSDGAQFKGILLRNLQALYAATGDAALRTFILANADSIWAYDRRNSSAGPLLDVVWSGPYENTSNAATQSSAMDALVAAAAVA